MWIDITGDDRLRIIKRLPSRWPEVIMARERGESLEHIATKFGRVPPPCVPGCRMFNPAAASSSGLAVVAEAAGEHEGPACLRYLVAECYNFIESALFDLAVSRARLLP